MACQHSHKTLTQCWTNVGSSSATLARHQTSTGSPPIVFAGLRSIAAVLVVLSAGDDYKPSPTQYLLNVGPASPVLASIHSALVRTSCWRYLHDALNKSWVIAGPPSVTLAHIQRGTEHNTVTQYWANVGSAS